MHKIEWGNLSIFADAPYAGARIETFFMKEDVGTRYDAPYAGARIETSLNWQSLQRIVMPLMRGRELKH